VVVIAGNVTIAAIRNGTGLATEFVPYRSALSIFDRSTFDLKCAGGNAPDKIGWKSQRKIGWYMTHH
jgi:hypothetical protein